MALLRWELKKIWRPGLLLAIAFIGAVFSQSRTGFYLEYFSTSNDRGGTQVQLASGWLETYREYHRAGGAARAGRPAGGAGGGVCWAGGTDPRDGRGGNHRL